MRHVYECPVRWADLDLLGHVNNVRYVDYLQEARADLLGRGDGTQPATPHDELVVARHEVQFVKPVHLTRRPLRVESWVAELGESEVVTAHEVLAPAVEDGADPVVCFRATSVLAAYDAGGRRALSETEREALRPWVGDGPKRTSPLHGPPGSTGTRAHRFPLTVRWSDLAAGGEVGDVTFVEYFQEARIAMFSDLRREHADGPDRPDGQEDWSAVVVATTDVDYLRPVGHGGGHEVRSWVSRLGGRSFDVDSEVRDRDGAVCARARVVLVTFDVGAERSAPMPPRMRETLSTLLLQPPGRDGGSR